MTNYNLMIINEKNPNMKMNKKAAGKEMKMSADKMKAEKMQAGKMQAGSKLQKMSSMKMAKKKGY